MKKIIARMITMVLLLAVFACPVTKAELTASDDGVIALQISEGAQKYAEEQAADNVIGKASLTEAGFDQMIQKYYQRTEQTLPECAVQNKLDCEEFEGSRVYTLSKENYENVILYIHGGAWVFNITADHVKFCDELATRLNARVYIPLYPLAPLATSTEGYAMLEALYKEILKEGKTVYLMGDSAGGNIALGLLYTAKAEGLAYPRKTVLLSPCVDMSFSTESIAELDKIDPILAAYGCKKCAELWAGKDNLKNPKNSPLYADVTGYPDTMIVLGTDGIIFHDALHFFENLKAAGVNTTLVLGEGLWHVFPLDEIPEKYTVLNLIEEYCAE